MIIKKRRAGVAPSFPPPAKKPMMSKPSPNLKMEVGVKDYPKPNPKKPFGEDSYFICHVQNTIGVADGVGGWSQHGIDAGQYARELMRNAMVSSFLQPKGFVNPRTVLKEAFLRTKSKGSSTACIASLKKNPKDGKHYLHAVNVGDSGFMIFRNNLLVFQSPTQQHIFNMPYQLGNGRDKPEKAEEFNVEVRAGDVVVFGTDGLFDNVYAKQIQRFVELSCVGEDKATPTRLAWNLAKIAQCNSKNCIKETPFSEAYRRAGKKHAGGKIDDITVLVAFIVSC